MNPIRFQMDDESGEALTVQVGRVCCRAEEKLAGNRMFIYRCQSIIKGIEKVFELKYEVGSCKWYLWKM